MQFNDTKETVEERTETTNFEGGEAYNPDSAEMGLYKVTVNNLLENKHYESDQESYNKVLQRFSVAADENPEFVLKLAAYARNEMGLRDIPQLLLVFAANDKRTQQYVEDYAPRVISRADELCTVIAMQLELFGKPIPSVLKNGVAQSFFNFDRYQLSKYQMENREVSLVDVVNLTHPNPESERAEEKDVDYSDIFERLVRGGLDDYPDVEPLDPPQTWEVEVSEAVKNLVEETEGDVSEDEKNEVKREAYEDVMDRMGLFAKIRNIRNMKEVGLSGEDILTDDDLETVEYTNMFPFRFYQSYKAVKDAGVSEPHIERWLSKAIDKTTSNLPDRLEDTAVLVDVSGSMRHGVSDRSNMTYKEIATFFGASLYRKGADAYVFASDAAEMDAHVDTPTLELQSNMNTTGVGGGTNAAQVVRHFIEEEKEYERIVVLTDLQMWGGATYGRNNSIKDEFTTYRDEVRSDTALYMLDLSSYGDLKTPEGMENVYNISGWNSRIIDFIENAERPGHVIQEIEEY